MSATVPPFARSLLAPRHWPAWIGLGLVRLAAALPHRFLLRAGAALGGLFARFSSARKRVAARNIELCFPELDSTAQARLLDDNLRDLGRMLAEFSLGWMASERAIDHIAVTIEGLQNVAALRKSGRGVLLVGGHFSHLELCARLLARELPVAGMYRQMDSAVFERAVLRARLGYAAAMFEKRDLRGCVRHLQGGGVLWYAPDQDMRGKDHVFAPFFGVPAATITATHHLARLSGAAVVPFAHRRHADGSYVLQLGEALADFPSEDVGTDTARVNSAIEEMVRAAPEQYLWVHKRFKTRPPGTAPLYR